MPRPMHSYHWCSLVEGGALALAGTALVFTAAYLKRSGDTLTRTIALILSFLWLALGWFRLGFALSTTSEFWLRLNEVLPTLFVCGALGWVGIKLLEGRTKLST